MESESEESDSEGNDAVQAVCAPPPQQQVQKKEGERLKHEEQMRENQAAKDREHERRCLAQAAREALTMRDSFENPEADEEYDPYSFGFGDE